MSVVDTKPEAIILSKKFDQNMIWIKDDYKMQ